MMIQELFALVIGLLVIRLLIAGVLIGSALGTSPFPSGKSREMEPVSDSCSQAAEQDNCCKDDCQGYENRNTGNQPYEEVDKCVCHTGQVALEALLDSCRYGIRRSGSEYLYLINADMYGAVIYLIVIGAELGFKGFQLVADF